MKITVAGLMVLFALGSKATDLVKIRTQLYRAAQDENEAKLLVQSLGEMKSRPVLYTGYMGMGYFLLAKHAASPFTKLSCFRKGRAMLERAIAEAPSNVELRFLRLTVQKSAPLFLDYSDNVAEDILIVKRAVLVVDDDDLKKRIADFLASGS